MKPLPCAPASFLTAHPAPHSCAPRPFLCLECPAGSSHLCRRSQSRLHLLQEALPMAAGLSPPQSLLPLRPGGSRDCTDHPPWSPGAARGSLDCCRVRMRTSEFPPGLQLLLLTALLSLSLVEGKSQAECQLSLGSQLSARPLACVCTNCIFWAFGASVRTDGSLRLSGKYRDRGNTCVETGLAPTSVGCFLLAPCHPTSRGQGPRLLCLRPSVAPGLCLAGTHCPHSGRHLCPVISLFN